MPIIVIHPAPNNPGTWTLSVAPPPNNPDEPPPTPLQVARILLGMANNLILSAEQAAPSNKPASRIIIANPGDVPPNKG